MAEVSRAEFDDVAAAIQSLIKRIAKAEEGLAASILVIQTLAETISELNPTLVDQKLRELRLLAQNTASGRAPSKLTKQYQDQLKILEHALGRQAPAALKSRTRG